MVSICIVVCHSLLDGFVGSEKNNSIGQIFTHSRTIFTENKLQVGKNTLNGNLSAWKSTNHARDWLNNLRVKIDHIPHICAFDPSHTLNIGKGVLESAQ